MTPEQYKTEALKTERVGAILYEEIDLRILHSIIGLGSEIEELANAKNLTNLQEEIGGMYWYLAIAYDVFDKNFCPTMLRVSYLDPVREIVLCISKLQDQFKKSWLCGHEISFDLFREIEGYLNGMAVKYNIRPTDIYDLNIRQLRTRHGENPMTPESSDNRNIIAEAQAMEKIQPED